MTALSIKTSFYQDKLILAFGPEVTGETLEAGNVETSRTNKRNGLTFYSYELKDLTRPNNT